MGARRFGDLANELVTAPRHSANQIAIALERPANGGDLRFESVLLDDPVGPDALDQGILADHPAVGFYQRHQHIEGSSRELGRRAIAQDVSTIRSDLPTTELEDRRQRSVRTPAC